MNDDTALNGDLRPEPTPDAVSKVERFAPSANMALSTPALVHAFESLVISRNGGVMIVGWVVDIDTPIQRIKVIGKEWSVTFAHSALARVRRIDAEEAMGNQVNHNFGYFGFMFVGEPIDPSGDIKIEVTLKSGWSSTTKATATVAGESELRDLVLAYLASVQHFGNQQIGAVACADNGLGAEIVAFNHSITDSLLGSPYVEHFGPRRRNLLGSIVVCLYGKPEYIFLQNALFSRGPGVQDYEFIYVCNSPEIADYVLGEARLGSKLYDIDQTVVILPGNAGFGAANNVAVNYASTDRILITNPDVFPYDVDWALKHTAIITNGRQEETRLFGAPLYYDNGSLMHAGMYFEIDKGPLRRGNRLIEWQLARVEHYGKGAPPDAHHLLQPRPIPAITGAFMSCDRSWFEELGGFTQDYVFGHYEDADLCLKSIQAGTIPWLHDVKLWHLEGHGSTRRPAHDGGSIVNRWLFSASWSPFISAELLGPKPQHPAFQIGPAVAPTPKLDESGRIVAATNAPSKAKRDRTA